MNALETQSDANLSKWTREKILAVEAWIANQPGAQFGNDFGVLKHTFAGSLYLRELWIPKGTFLAGRVHRYEHPLFILEGDITIFDEFDGGRRIKAPVYFVSKPGVKRIIFAHEDTRMVNCNYVDGERDVPTVEDMTMAWTYEDYDRGYEKGLKCPETSCLQDG